MRNKYATGTADCVKSSQVLLHKSPNMIKYRYKFK
jgi:hypothetical protein